MLPTFVVIGAMRSGTTSLHNYLQAHPDVFMPEGKELDFFLEDRFRGGLEWYEERFAAAGSCIARGEASPNYTKYPMFPGVPERMATVIPDARLIYVLRDPLERMCSHYIHNVSKGRERRQAAEALVEDPRYVDASRYAMQVTRFLDHYPRSQLLLVTSEALRKQREATLSRIFEFVGVDPNPATSGFDLEYHQRASMRQPTGALRTARAVVPAAVRARMPWRMRTLAAGSLSQRLPSVTPSSLPDATRRILVERISGDVRELRRLMPADFNGWGFG